MPESVGFDIEVKMTTPDAEPHTAPQEVDRMVAAILTEVREWEAVSYRRMVFSSFDPDVAAELRRRQTSVPVSLWWITPHACAVCSAVCSLKTGHCQLRSINTVSSLQCK